MSKDKEQMLELTEADAELLSKEPEPLVVMIPVEFEEE